MPKDTKTLGNSKARACESLGFVHKKGCARVLTQPPAPVKYTLNINDLQSHENALCNPLFAPLSFPVHPFPLKTPPNKKTPHLFPVFSPNSYICTKLSAQSEETQRTPHRY